MLKFTKTTEKEGECLVPTDEVSPLWLEFILTPQGGDKGSMV